MQVSREEVRNTKDTLSEIFQYLFSPMGTPRFKDNSSEQVTLDQICKFCGRQAYSKAQREIISRGQASFRILWFTNSYIVALEKFAPNACLKSALGATDFVTIWVSRCIYSTMPPKKIFILDTGILRSFVCLRREGLTRRGGATSAFDLPSLESKHWKISPCRPASRRYGIQRTLYLKFSTSWYTLVNVS